MSDSNFKIGNLSGKGLAIAIGACVLAVGAAGYYSYTKISDRLNAEVIGENRDTLSAEDPAANADGELPDAPANAVQSEIAKTETAAPDGEPAESAAVTTEVPKSSETGQTTTLPEQQPSQFAMVRPLNGEVINAYSDGELVKSKTLNVWKTHDGVDIAGALNEQVKSMTGGTVTRVYEDQMLGACVIIDHGSGLEGYYCNLSKDISVAEGQSVSAGTVIGAVGNTAENEISEEPHLHFAVKKNGEWIDPIALISGEGS